jgi:cation diffusion facilitator family transporter
MNFSIEKQKYLVATLSVFSNTFLVVGKIIVGILTGSVSILSEAIHSGIDLLASLIALFAVKQSSKAPDQKHPYGHGKFENVSGTIEALLIFLAAIWIIYEAIHKLINPSPLANEGLSLGLLSMFFSVIVNTVVSQMLFHVAKKADSMALEADAWHLRADIYTSLGVMIGLSLIWILQKSFPHMNFQWIDPLMAILVALFIIKTAYDLTLKAGRDLFDVELSKNELDEINKILNKIMLEYPAIKKLIHLKTRKAGATCFIDLDLQINSNLKITEFHYLSNIVTKELEISFKNSQISIHLVPDQESSHIISEIKKP